MNDGQTFRALEANRSNNFDALRVLFALLVIVSHSYPLLLGSNDREPLMRASGSQMTLGEVAVDGFFLISGYLITASWQRSRNAMDYLRRRVLRIYPGFLVAVAFCSFVAGPLIVPNASLYWQNFQFKNWLFPAFNLEGAYSPGIETNGSLWSIRYEFLCYVAVAALGLAGLLKWPAILLGITLGCTFLQALQTYRHFQMPGSRLSWLWCYPDFWPRLAACYLAGALFHLWGDRIVQSRRLAMLSAVGLMLAAAVPSAKLLPLLFPYLAGYLTFWLAYAPLGSIKDIARRGDLTYGLYLYAFPIQLLLIKRFGEHLSPLGLAAVATLVTGLFAAVSWHLVEKPCLRWKRSSRPA